MDPCVLVLYDNILFGIGLTHYLRRAVEQFEASGGVTVFGYHVDNSERFGVVGLDENRNVISTNEKSESPKSFYAVRGLYFCDSHVCALSKTIGLGLPGFVPIQNNISFNVEFKRTYTFVNLAEPELAIDWPISLSEADRNHPIFADAIPMAPRRTLAAGCNGRSATNATGKVA